MPRRVSVKGKGADLFFGDYAPEDTEQKEKLESDETCPSTEPGSGADEVSEQESAYPSENASAPVGLREDSGGFAINSPRNILNGVWDVFAEKATVSNTFRYTDSELSQLFDTIYEIAKQHKVKLSKQDVVRLGLLAVLWEYKNNGLNSLLGELIKKKTGH